MEAVRRARYVGGEGRLPALSPLSLSLHVFTHLGALETPPF